MNENPYQTPASDALPGERPSFTDQFLTYLGFLEAPETRALYRAWKERPQLDDETFYQTFYADSGIAKHVVIDVRREMQAVLGMSLAGVHPTDDLETAAPELDFADVFYRFEKDLNVVIPWRTATIDFDFTFDSLVRLIADCMANKYPVPSPIDREHTGIRIRHLPFFIAGVCIIVLAITSSMTFFNTANVMIWVVVPATILLINIPLCIWLWRRGLE